MDSTIIPNFDTMSEQDEAELIDSTTNNETEETTVEESQENLESDFHDEDAELTPQAKAFKEKRREENRQAREALKEVPQLKAELEFNKFLRKSPEAEEYEQDIKDFRAKNPTIWLEQAFKYVLADKDPARLAELSDSGAYAQKTQGRTAPAVGDKSFSEHVGDNINLNDMDALKRAAEKDYASMMG